MSHDLQIDRTFKAPRKAIWRCWTETDLLKQWFCPKPWGVEHAEFDLKPGGKSMVIMKGPNGERFENPGCWLEVVPMERLVFTEIFAPFPDVASEAGADHRREDADPRGRR